MPQSLKEEDNRKLQTLVGESGPMAVLRDLIARVANTEANVLITGESGTEKELVAQTIHENSIHKNRPIVSLNCLVTPEPLLEARLFGYNKPRPRGRVETRPGAFEQAIGGTILLNDIGEMGPNTQVKLLGAFSDKEFERVGGRTTHSVAGIRFIASTSGSLIDKVKEGTFREDLYYLIAVLAVEVPPLRDRRSDIPLLVEALLSKADVSSSHRALIFSPNVMGALCDYHWPGNLRELGNILTRLIIFSTHSHGNRIDADTARRWIETEKSECVPVRFQIPDQGISLEEAVQDYETKLIIAALKKANGLKTYAARLLNIPRKTLIQKMMKLGLSEQPEVYKLKR